LPAGLIRDVPEETSRRIHALALLLRPVIEEKRRLAAGQGSSGQSSGKARPGTPADVLVRPGDIEAGAAPAVGAEELVLQPFMELDFPGLPEAAGLGGKTKTAPARCSRRCFPPTASRRPRSYSTWLTAAWRGRARATPKRRGAPARRRGSTARLVTLAAAVNAGGYLKRSQTLPGNVSEPAAFRARLEDRGAG
jgi:hypothetical protein